MFYLIKLIVYSWELHMTGKEIKEACLLFREIAENESVKIHSGMMRSFFIRRFLSPTEWPLGAFAIEKKGYNSFPNRFLKCSGARPSDDERKPANNNLYFSWARLNRRTKIVDWYLSFALERSMCSTCLGIREGGRGVSGGEEEESLL